MRKEIEIRPRFRMAMIFFTFAAMLAFPSRPSLAATSLQVTGQTVLPTMDTWGGGTTQYNWTFNPAGGTYTAMFSGNASGKQLTEFWEIWDYDEEAGGRVAILWFVTLQLTGDPGDSADIILDWRLQHLPLLITFPAFGRGLPIPGAHAYSVVDVWLKTFTTDGQNILDYQQKIFHDEESASMWDYQSGLREHSGSYDVVTMNVGETLYVWGGFGLTVEALVAPIGEAYALGIGVFNFTVRPEGIEAPPTIRVHNITQDTYYTTIQSAIDDANNADHIEVWSGVHYEAINLQGKAITLYSSDGPQATIINGNGAPHVIQCVTGEDANTVLDGFTITGGNAGGSWPDNCGGGMYNERSNPTVRNCIFTGNSASEAGGGMYNHVYNEQNGGSPTVTNCTFRENNATNGGGMCNDWNSCPAIKNCTFSGNTSTEFGGGLYNANSSSPALTNCTLSGNSTAGDGGGIYNERSNPTLINCIFNGNLASAFGGGMCNHIYNEQSGESPIVINCTFTGNSAVYGGGMYNDWWSWPTLTNCTFSKNTASEYGGGLCSINNSCPTLTNCILWGDEPDEVYNYDASSSAIVTYSDVQEGWGDPCDPNNTNINADPNFVREPNNGGDGWTVGNNDDFGDLHLSVGSPCADAGDNNSVPIDTTDLDNDGNTVEPIPFDLDGNPRIVEVVDMGAFELSLRVHNITQDTYYTTIQSAIDEANNSDHIEVWPGVHYEAINLQGKAVTLYSSDGPQATIINGNGAPHVVQCVNGEDANTILDGFTITGGNAEGNWPEDCGGGMYNDRSNPTVTNCIFTGNSASEAGGGMYNHVYNEQNGGSPTVTNCTFRSNSAAYGGGMSNDWYSCPAITNCLFSDNSATEFGGGLYNTNNSNPTLTNCTLSSNSASPGYGGGLCNASLSYPTLTNCILWGDEPDEIYNYDASSSAIVTYSDVQGGWGDPCDPGNTNINEGPYFIDAAGGDLRLQVPDSPCLDAGNNNAVPLDTIDLDGDGDTTESIPFDLDGNERIVGQAVDMGAYESLNEFTNTEPTACIANNYFEAEGPHGATITLDGSCSSDADSTPGTNDDIDEFNWHELDPCNPGGPGLFIGSGEVLDCDLSLGMHLITLEVIDKAGAFDSIEAAIAVLDGTPPEINCPADITLEATGPGGAVGTFTASATDLCDKAPEITFDPCSGSIFELGTTEVNCVATDISGNSSSCNFNVTVEDTTPPEINCPADITLEATGPGGAVGTFTASATDLCDKAPEITFDPCSGSMFPMGTTEVTCVATDISGNSSSCNFNVTVEDTTPPEINCPADITLEATGPDGAVGTFTVSATDLYDKAPTITIDPPSGSMFPMGTTQVTCTATDSSGNSSSCTFSVTAGDITPPVITVGDMVRIWPSNHKYRCFKLSDLVVSVEDNCGGLLDVDEVGTIISIYSDEPEDAKGWGDGKTKHDMVILGSNSFMVRAERNGKGNGRVYGITFEVVDEAGNTATGTCYVGVPHYKFGQAPTDDGPASGYTVYPKDNWFHRWWRYWWLRWRRHRYYYSWFRYH